MKHRGKVRNVVRNPPLEMTHVVCVLWLISTNGDGFGFRFGFQTLSLHCVMHNFFHWLRFGFLNGYCTHFRDGSLSQGSGSESVSIDGNEPLSGRLVISGRSRIYRSTVGRRQPSFCRPRSEGNVLLVFVCSQWVYPSVHLGGGTVWYR